MCLFVCQFAVAGPPCHHNQRRCRANHCLFAAWGNLLPSQQQHRLAAAAGRGVDGRTPNRATADYFFSFLHGEKGCHALAARGQTSRDGTEQHVAAATTAAATRTALTGKEKGRPSRIFTTAAGSTLTSMGTGLLLYTSFVWPHVWLADEVKRAVQL